MTDSGTKKFTFTANQNNEISRLNADKFLHRLLQRCLDILTENQVITFFHNKFLLPNDKKLTLTQMSGVIVIISMCDEAMSMGLPKNFYPHLFFILSNVAISHIHKLEEITSVTHMKKYIEDEFRDNANAILMQIAKFDTPAWSEDFKLSDSAISYIQTIPQAHLFISKLIVLIQILSYEFVNKCMTIMLQSIIKVFESSARSN